MKKITMKKAEKIIRESEKMKKEAGVKYVRVKFFEELIVKHGFSYAVIGTGKKAYTCSGSIEIKELRGKRWLNGKYLIIGSCNYARGGYPQYRGYALKIEN